MVEIPEIFSVLDENGDEIQCNALLMFSSPESEKDIVIYKAEDTGLLLFAYIRETNYN